jgi:Flp pilus assembly protein TadD
MIGMTSRRSELPGNRRDWRDPAIAAGLLLLVLAIFLPASDYAFIYYDDGLYVYENPRVLAGLSPAGVAWAFTTFHANNWHPLAWLSHMADVSLFGPDPAAHHLVNFLLHAANAILLFLVLRRATGARWRSALVAALFAAHPLHVQSVAWVAERKDLLSTLFGLASAGAYLRYVERPGAARFLAVALLFALSLLSKPMLVTLPFVLLLADRWPLARPEPWRHRVREKLPLLALAAVSAVVTVKAQAATNLAPLDLVPLGDRLANAVLSYGAYLYKTVAPFSLAIVYPHPSIVREAASGWAVAGASVLLLAATAGAATQFRRRPWLPVGWFCFLGMLVPVIGVVQAGTLSMADRYTYLPLVGIFVAVVWSVPLVEGARARRAAAAAAGTVLLLLAAESRVQAAYWHDSESLFRRAIAVAPGNWEIRNNLGVYLSDRGRYPEAVEEYLEALKVRPDDTVFRTNLAKALTMCGRKEEAEAQYRLVLAARPGASDARTNLAILLLERGERAEGVRQLREANLRDPGYAPAREALADLAAAGLLRIP